MKRRTYITTSSTALLTLSGCIETMSTDGVSKTFPRVSVQPDPVSKDIIDIEMIVTKQFSKTEPAKLQIRFTNTGDTDKEMMFGPTPPFSTYLSSNRDPAMVLIPDHNKHIHAEGADQIIPDEPSDGCWKEQGNGMVIWGTGTSMVFEPGESVSQSYTIIAQHNNEPCFQEGEYRYEEPHYFAHELSWGFDLTLST